MRSLVCLVITCLVSIAPGSVSAQADARARFAYFVIGPDSLAVRSWTATWIDADLFKGASSLRAQVLPWRAFLEHFLDTDDELLEGRQPPGPSAPSEIETRTDARYPWDLREELPFIDMQMIVRMSRLTSVAQVVLRPGRNRHEASVIVLDSADGSRPDRTLVHANSLRALSDSITHRLATRWRDRAIRAPAR